MRELIGKGGDKLVPEVTGLADSSHEAKRLQKERAALFSRVYLPQLRAFPQAEALLRKLREIGLELVVASSAGEDELQPLLEVCGALPFVQHKTSSDDAAHSKPDPDIVQAALRKSGYSAGEAVMLGDTPYDVQAAAKAGVPAIALRSGGHPGLRPQRRSRHLRRRGRPVCELRQVSVRVASLASRVERWARRWDALARARSLCRRA